MLFFLFFLLFFFSARARRDLASGAGFGAEAAIGGALTGGALTGGALTGWAARLSKATVVRWTK